MPCKHVRGSFVCPGWGCCKCRAYNGYQRTTCRNRGHVPCYETTSKEGREALELKPIGSSPILLRAWMEKHDKAQTH